MKPMLSMKNDSRKTAEPADFPIHATGSLAIIFSKDVSPRSLAMVMWGMQLLLFGLFLLLGFISDHGFGVLVFTIFPASILLNVFMLISLLATGVVHISIKVAWGIISVSAVVLSFFGEGGEILATYLTLIQSFPIGIGVMYAVSNLWFVLEDWFSITALTSFVIVPTLLFDYWQWFWLFPRLVKWAKDFWERRKSQ
jgi:hypothetical protein